MIEPANAYRGCLDEKTMMLHTLLYILPRNGLKFGISV